MKFSEKLQNLRKEKHFSQEQLADMLDVSRQSVSKWESGQTYPEMDKLLSMCKIFNCTLDELTNDEIKEVSSKEKNKNNFSNLIDEVFDIFDRSVKTFKNANSKQIAGFVFELVLVGIFILLCRIPLSYIYNLICSIFADFNFPGGNVIYGIFRGVSELAYILFALIIIFFAYKKRFLDRFADLKDDSKVIKDENKNNNEVKEETKQNKQEKHKEEKSYKLFSVLGNIIIFFLKIFTFIVSLPFIFSLVGIVICLVISIILIFKGVIYLGIPLMIISGLGLNILLLELIVNFLFNKKTNVNRTFITLISSLVLFGVGFGITTIDVANTKYIDNANDYKLTTISHEYNMSEEIMIPSSSSYYYDNIEYIVDNNLKNKLKVEVTYYKDFNNITINNGENYIYVYSDYNLNGFSILNNKYSNLIINDLSKKQIHNYSLLSDYKIKIYTSESNINKIKLNMKNNEDNYVQSEIDNLYDQISNLNDQIGELEEKNNRLIEENNYYKEEIEEYKLKIQDYKDKINSIINEG